MKNTTLNILLFLLGTLGNQLWSEENTPQNVAPKSAQQENIASEQVSQQKFSIDDANKKLYSFAFRCLKSVSKGTPNDNVVISPFGNYILLTSLALGSDETTKQQLCDALEIDNNNLTCVNKLKETASVLQTRPEMKLVNTLWLQNDKQLNQQYVEQLQQALATKIRNVNFQSPDIVSIINSWANIESDGMITKLFDSLSADTQLVLSNIIVFKGEWKNLFNAAETKECDFNNLDGSKSKVQMMTQKNRFRYHQGDEYQWLEMPYQNDTFSMIVLLPTSQDIFASFDQRWKPLFLENAETNAEEKEITVSFPKFSTSLEYDLTSALQDMGIDMIFTTKANFKPMVASNDIMVSQVKQSIVLEIDEKGTKAAAATAASIISKSVPQEILFTVDRPFYFLIKENQTGTILFMGRVIKM